MKQRNSSLTVKYTFSPPFPFEMGMVVNPTCLYYAFRGDIDERQSLVSLTFPRSTFPNRIASKSFE